MNFLHNLGQEQHCAFVCYKPTTVNDVEQGPNAQLISAINSLVAQSSSSSSTTTATTITECPTISWVVVPQTATHIVEMLELSTL